MPLTLNGMPIQVPPTTGHSNTFVVPDAGPVAVGEYRSDTVHVPGPVNPPPVPQLPKSKPNGALSPEPDATSVLYPASTLMVTVLETVVLIGTFPYPTGFGLADATLTPAPCTSNGMPVQLPPATGHSNTFVVPDAAATDVGANRSVTVHVPGPVNPPPAPQLPKSNANGALSPEPDATSVLYPASTVIVTERRHRRVDRNVPEADGIRAR